MEKKCLREGCNVSFFVPPAGHSGWDRKYCSRQCKEKSRKANANQRVFVLGDRVVRLMLLERISIGNRLGWKCRCDCGQECLVRHDKLRSGRTQSCGCLHTERVEADKAERVLRQREKIKRQTLTFGLVDLKKKIIQTKKEVLNYHNFDMTGHPRKMAKEFQDWAFIVCNVLKDGPVTDKVTIKVTVEVQHNSVSG